MKVAIFSDVHGNLSALEAVIADLEALQPDFVVHGGDLALNGPRPAECIDRIRELGWPGVVGNADQALWSLPHDLPQNTIRTFEVLVAATRQTIGIERERWLRSLAEESGRRSGGARPRRARRHLEGRSTRR